jgi:Protein of unknown function (DUF1266)
LKRFLLMGAVLGLLLLAAWLMEVQRRLKWRADLGGRYPVEVRRGLELIDLAARGLLVGREITGGALTECGEAFTQLFRYLQKRSGTDNNQRFAVADRAAFYLYAVKLAALEHPDHNAWPLRASIRAGLVKSLRPMLGLTQDAWTQLAFITPALVARDVDLAERLYRKLPPILAQIARQWINETVIGYRDFNHIPSSTRLLAALGAATPSIPPATADPLAPDQRWAISVAVYPSYASDPRAGLADPLPPAVCRLALVRWWEVTDPESAIGMLEWLLDRGHREELARELDLLSTDELSPAKRAFLIENETELREHQIAAWDLCRLVNVARSAYKAGHIDEPTAWHFILAAARELRDTYASWSDLGDDYLLGLRYFADDHQADPTHRASVEWLQRAPSSPWRTIAWDAESRR